jgi:hypothetical protein
MVLHSLEADVGFNTSMIVLNDALDAIAKDKDFGEKVAEAIHHLPQHKHFRPGHGVDIASGCNANAATIIETHHADYTTLLAFGGNCVSELGSVYAFRHNTEDVQVMLLKMLAEKLGYEVTKIPEVFRKKKK